MTFTIILLTVSIQISLPLRTYTLQKRHFLSFKKYIFPMNKVCCLQAKFWFKKSLCQAKILTIILFNKNHYLKTDLLQQTIIKDRKVLLKKRSIEMRQCFSLLSSLRAQLCKPETKLPLDFCITKSSLF